MKITTKFNIGDTKFIMLNNEITTVKIIAISISVDPNLYVEYHLKAIYPSYQTKLSTPMRDDKIFGTKEELVANLLKK